MEPAPLSAYARPGLMLSQVWPDARDTEGETLRGLETALAHPFFETFHSVDVLFPKERAAIGRVARERKLDLTCGLSRIASHGKHHLSDLDEGRREAAVAAHAAVFDGAREMGARYVQVNSGPAPADPARRGEALARLEASLAALAEAAAPDVGLLIEPLDVTVHKKGTLGYAPEALALCRAVPGLGLCVDTAHMTLNGEAIEGALPALLPHTGEFHFCNCVTTPGHPLHGDHHVPFGPPGALDVADVGRIMAAAVRCGLFSREARPRVFCEERRTTGQAPEDVVDHARAVLEGGWDAARAHLADA